MEKLTIQEELNENIKQVLRERKKSIKWLANELKMNSSSLYTILNKKGNKIDMALYGELLKPLNLNVSDLLKTAYNSDDTIYFNSFIDGFILSEKTEKETYILLDRKTKKNYELTETEKSFLILQLKKKSDEYIREFINVFIKGFND